MLNFGASKPRVKGGGPGPQAPPLDPHLTQIRTHNDGLLNLVCLVVLCVTVSNFHY